MTHATLIFGVPADNMPLFHRLPHAAHDPAAWIKLPDDSITILVRDVELASVRALVTAGRLHADRVVCYEDVLDPQDLDPDRPIRAAKALRAICTAAAVRTVTADRSLNLLAVDELRAAGIEIVCDRDLGVLDRRRKSPAEVEALRTAQLATERAILLAAQMIWDANPDADGILHDEQGVLTAERVHAAIDAWLAERNCASDGHVVAPGPIGADCHAHGHGPIRTAEPVIIDVFPKHRDTGYHADCTRTVVHGTPPPELQRMLDTVARAKQAALAACRAGVTGADVHNAAADVITAAGYTLDFPNQEHLERATASRTPTGFCSMPHGTGHGIGLELKEPPLLDNTGPELLEADAVTIEPGLYAPGLGGVRIEDLVIVRATGVENLNTLPNLLTPPPR